MVGGLVLLGVAFGALALRDVLTVRSQAADARAMVQSALDDSASLRSHEGRVAALTRIDAGIAGLRQSRRALLDSRALSVADGIPLLRSQRAGLLQLLDDSQVAVGAGRELVARVDALAEQNQIRDGSIPLQGLAESAAALRTAGETVGTVADGARGPWAPVGAARRQFDELAESGSRRLLDGADAVGAARTFMGGDGSRRYLAALQNNAEMRNQGAILSYVVLRFSDGRFAVERRGSTAELPLGAPTATQIPDGTREVFGSILPTQLWQSVNATADFPLSALAMVDMYQAATGETLDGIVALDVPALASVLRMIGPVSIEGVAEPLTAENASRLLLHDFYEGLSPDDDQSARRERLGDVLQSVIDKLVTGTRDGVSFGLALGESARGGHFRLWSRAEAEERVFERTGLGGGPATVKADRTFHLAVENRTGTKLDYYVKPSVRQRIELARDGSATVRTSVVVRNEAPVDAPASYVLGPDQYMERPGQYLAWLLLWPLPVPASSAPASTSPGCPCRSGSPRSKPARAARSPSRPSSPTRCGTAGSSCAWCHRPACTRWTWRSSSIRTAGGCADRPPGGAPGTA